MRLKSGRCQVGGFPLKGSSKILNLYAVAARWIEFSKWVNIKIKLNLLKIGDSTMGVLPKRALQNSTFLTF